MADGMNEDLVLAIDQGGQSTRVAVYTRRGRCVLTHATACQTVHFEDGRIEQDPEAILGGLRESLAFVARKLGKRCRHLVAAGFAGQGSSLMAWDTETGDPLSPVISWQDTRGARYLDDLHLSDVFVKSRTGLNISAHYGASKMRWCLEQLPAVRHAADNGHLMMGPLAGYLFAELLESERIGVDPGQAQRTLLWSIESGDWDEGLLSAFAIERHQLPNCRRHDSCYGHLPLGGKRVPVLSVQRDQGASLFARGRPNPGTAYVNIGTGAFLQRVTSDRAVPEGLLLSPLWIAEHGKEPPLYAWEATVNGAAAALPWLREEAGLPVSPADMAQSLNLALDPERTIYLLNAEGGLSAPYWRIDLTSEFSEGLSPEEKIVAWIESVVFQLTLNHERMAEYLGPPDNMVVSGGLGQTEGLCQRLANLTGVAVYRTDNPEATLMGVAYTAAGRPETWPGHTEGQIFHPEPDRGLKARFGQWQQALERWLQ